MNSKEIEKILERYYEGDTTLEEERILREFFQGGNVPAHLEVFRRYFRYNELERSVTGDPGRIAGNVTGHRPESKIISMIRMNKGRIIRISGVAATILAFAGIYFLLNPVAKKVDATISDPATAYQETKKILLYVSGKLNKGTEQVEKIAKLDETTEKLSSLSKFNQGIEEVSKIKDYNQIEKVFGTNK